MSAQATVDIWNEERRVIVERMLAGGGKPGLARPEMLTGKTGLEIMQAMLAGELPYPHIAQTLDFSLIEVGPGTAVFQGTPQLAHYNPLGSVHGGWETCPIRMPRCRWSGPLTTTSVPARLPGSVCLST